MERNEFNERIQKEFDDFKAETLDLTKEQIFEKGFEIDFKSYMTEYLQNSESIDNKTCEKLAEIDGTILNVLYEIYCDNDTYYIYEDMCEEIIEIYQNYSEDEEIE